MRLNSDRLGHGGGHDALDQLVGPLAIAGTPMRHDGGAVVGEARLHLERLEEVEEQLGVLRAARSRAPTDVGVAVHPEHDPQLPLGPMAPRRPRWVTLGNRAQRGSRPQLSRPRCRPRVGVHDLGSGLLGSYSLQRALQSSTRLARIVTRG